MSVTNTLTEERTETMNYRLKPLEVDVWQVPELNVNGPLPSVPLWLWTHPKFVYITPNEGALIKIGAVETKVSPGNYIVRHRDQANNGGFERLAVVSNLLFKSEYEPVEE